jgi:hypothetical protein
LVSALRLTTSPGSTLRIAGVNRAERKVLKQRTKDLAVALLVLKTVEEMEAAEHKVAAAVETLVVRHAAHNPRVAAEAPR